MIRVPLTDGVFALVDEEDAPLVGRLNWRLFQPRPGAFYAMARGHVSSGGGRGSLMHRLILGAPLRALVDHINGDGLDNRRSNLRLASPSQNGANQLSRTGSSRFKGVSWSRRDQNWAAFIHVDRRTRPLGRYSSEEEAAKAYDAAAREAFGRFAAVNFPRAGERGALRSLGGAA